MPEEEQDRQIIPIVEETVRVDKRETVSGKVRVRTEVNSVEQVVRETLTDETVEVTRVPIDQRIDQVPDIRTENGVTILPSHRGEARRREAAFPERRTPHSARC